MSVQIKICGITNLDDALMAVEMGADALGLNFYQPSARYLDVHTALTIQRALPLSVKVVGVFVNASVTEIIHIQQQVGFCTAQLHGDEPISLCTQLPLPIIKAYRPKDISDLNAAMAWHEKISILLDAVDEKYYGGSGKQADWAIARTLASQRQLILAGGLTAENVAVAIQQVKPVMVDVCSGVEMYAGRKSRIKMQAFFDAVRGATL